MPNQINSKNTPETYDAISMYDLASLAESDMRWMEVAITDIKKRIKELKKDLGINATGFHALDNILDMYEYLAENRLKHYEDEAEAYKAEQENKKAVTL